MFQALESQDSLELRLDGFEKHEKYIKNFCWVHLEHYELDPENNSLLPNTRISLGHAKTIVGFLILNCMIFIGMVQKFASPYH